MLQETLSLPPVDSEAVNRLVLERCVTAGCRGRWSGPHSWLWRIAVHVGVKAMPPAWETAKVSLGSSSEAAQPGPGCQGGAGHRGSRQPD